MSTSAILSRGLTLGIGDGGGTEVFTAIGELTNVAGPNLSSTVIDVSDLDSNAREKAIGLLDGGEVTFELNYLPADTEQTSLRTVWQNRTLRNFEITYTDSGSTVCSFAAYVTGISPTAAVDDKITGSVTLTVSGLPTWA